VKVYEWIHRRLRPKDRVTTEKIVYRPAAKGDCTRLAELSHLASGGVADFLFEDMFHGVTSVEIMTHGLAQEAGSHSYRNILVAQKGEDVVGMALSFPSEQHGVTDQMRAFFPAERLDHMQDFYNARVEKSWFLDAIGVRRDMQGQGIGCRLVELTKERAREKGRRVVSLIAFADNTPALALYRRQGFEVVQTVRLDPAPLIPHRGGCVLMRCDLDP